MLIDVKRCATSISRDYLTFYFEFSFSSIIYSRNANLHMWHRIITKN